LNKEDIDRWIDDALIEVQLDTDYTLLSETQFARIKLICTLRYDIEEDILPIVLDLLDQLHATRQHLHSLSQAVLAQNADVKLSILEAISKVR
jgi:chaperone modulatory protein CbpM